MTEIDTSPEAIEKLAADLRFDYHHTIVDAIAMLRALAAEKRDLSQHAAWKLGYASGLSAAKKGSAP